MRVDVDRLTSLFRGRFDVAGLRKIGAVEPWEKMDGASGPTLDLVLS